MSYHQARKRFAQHFLIDPFMIEKIVQALLPKPHEHLIEIGGGLGALTFPVLNHAKQLEVIEFDRDLAEKLKTHHQAGLVVHQADALHFDFAKLKNDNRSLRLFGNLPYNIATPLIFHLLKYSDTITDMFFMFQKEVAHRLTAKIGTKDYSRLTIMVQYYCDVKLLFHVPASAFNPSPQVISSMVHLTPYHPPPHVAQDPKLFANLVKQAFLHRRKTLRNSLKGLIDDKAWSYIKVHSDLRPERLTVQDFVEMCNVMSKQRINE